MGKHVGGQSPNAPACRWIGDRGLRVQTGEATLARLAALGAQEFTELEDMIPADDNLLLVLRSGAEVSAALWAALADPLTDAQETPGRCHEIAVEYGGIAGPDLAALAERAGMDAPTYIMRRLSTLWLSWGFSRDFRICAACLTPCTRRAGRPRGFVWRRAAWRLVERIAGSIRPGVRAAGISSAAHQGSCSTRRVRRPPC
jgi:allophanate hydrolase subunit 1